MNTGEALKIVSKYGPCPHFNLYANINNGPILFAKCQDCKQEITRKSIQQCRNNSIEFDMAIETLAKIVNPLMEAHFS